MKDLIFYIIDDTQMQIINAKFEIEKSNFTSFNENFSQLFKTTEKLFNLIVANKEGLGYDYNSSVSLLLKEITDVRDALKSKRTTDYVAYEKLTELIAKIKQGKTAGICFSEEEINRYLNKRNDEIRESEKRRELAKNKHLNLAFEKRPLVDKWLDENGIENFDATQITDLERKVIEEGLKTDFKMISISFLQRKFVLGYVKSVACIERLMSLGAISSKDEIKHLGLPKGHLIKIKSIKQEMK